jgi:hypothetical protein
MPVLAYLALYPLSLPAVLVRVVLLSMQAVSLERRIDRYIVRIASYRSTCVHGFAGSVAYHF